MKYILMQQRFEKRMMISGTSRNVRSNLGVNFASRALRALCGDLMYCRLFAGALLLAAGAQEQPYPPRHLEPTTDPRSWSVEEVQSWVESIGFREYKLAFLEGDVDGKKLLGMTAERLGAELLLPAREHVLLIEMELAELKVSRGLEKLTADERMAARYDLSHMGVAQVGALLHDAGLEKYVGAFARRGLDGPKLLALSDADLRAALSVPPNPNEENEAALEVLRGILEHHAFRLQRRRGPRLHGEL